VKTEETNDRRATPERDGNCEEHRRYRETVEGTEECLELQETLPATRVPP
jgi:hypothetical protein